MGYVTDKLNSIDCEKENTEELYEIFNSIDDYALPVIKYYITAGGRFLRIRINEEGKEFYKVSDLNYPPAICIKNYGRANLPFHSMFYCCSFTQDPNAMYPRLICIQETSNFFKNKDSSGIERNTCSVWTNDRKLELIAIPFNDNYERATDDIKYIQKEWEREVAKSEINKDGLELIEFMSKEISQEKGNNKDYFKIANFVFYLLYCNKKTKNADGIIYPSVPARGEGFNIAIKPKVVDECMRIEGCSLQYLAKIKDKSYLKVVNYSSIDEQGNITYKERPYDREEEIIYNDYASNLKFVN